MSEDQCDDSDNLELPREDLAKLTRAIANGGITDRRELYRAIHALGHERYRAAKPVIESCLSHPDPQIRRAALSVLTLHWSCLDHRETCERFIREEDDVDAHRMGITGLGVLLRGTEDRLALRLLAPVVRDAEANLWTREAAYQAVLSIMGSPPREHPTFRDYEDLMLKVDWDLISRIEADADLRLGP